MIAMLVRRLALTFLLAFVLLAVLEQFNPAPPPLVLDLHLHRADYERCFTIHDEPGPAPARFKLPYRRRKDMA